MKIILEKQKDIMIKNFLYRKLDRETLKLGLV